LYQKNTIAKFSEEGVVMQSYRSLRDGKAFDNSTLVKMAQAKNKMLAQILGRWCVQKGFVCMIVENAQVFDFELTTDEIMELDGDA
jgi:diketogulonate reductase-like aldo/keto reductase